MTYDRQSDLSIGSYVLLALSVVGWEALGPSATLIFSAVLVATLLIVSLTSASSRHCAASRRQRPKRLQQRDGEPAQMGGAKLATNP